VQDAGHAAVVDAPGGVRASGSAVGEDERVDAWHGRCQARGVLEVALEELDAGKQALASLQVPDERRDGEVVSLCGRDHAASDAAGRADDEHA
jgi:hypothetical protein